MHKLKFIGPLLMLLLIGLAMPLAAQFDVERDPIKVEAFLSQTALSPGGSAHLAVVCTIPRNQHLTSNFNEVTLPADSPFSFGEVIMPDGIQDEDEIIFKGKVPFIVPVTAPSDLEPGDYELELSLRFQVCAELPTFMCFAPESKTTALTIKVVGASSRIEPAHAEFFSKVDPTMTKPALADGPPPEVRGETASASVDIAQIRAEQEAAGSADTLEGRVQKALNSNPILAFFLVFIGGFLTSLTPCVYPMIPITISYVGGRAKNKLHGFTLSLFFVLGIAIMYSALGILAASTGSLFGGMLQNPVAITIVALVFVAMGASMFGAFDLVVPASVQTRLQSKQRGGLIGAVMMGIVTGIVASPCVGPVLVVLLTWVAQTGNVFLGFWLLFTFAIGMGMLFLVIGTFSGVMSSLPQAGGWMETVKHFFGVILMAMAIYYIKPLIPETLFLLLIGALMIAFGTFAGAVKALTGDESTWGQKLVKSVAVMALIAGIFYLVFGLSTLHGISPGSSRGATVSVSAHEGLDWVMDEQVGLAQARAAGKPVLIDFYADWCAACIELDEKTWVVDSIKEESKRFVSIKMDFTDTDSPETTAMMSKYEIKGMPTVIFINTQGEEQTRFVGFKPADEVLPIMTSIK